MSSLFRMKRVVIVGGGIVGAAIAYELSQVPSLTVTLLDKQPPAQGSTGAALGVLMGAISQKKKGRTWAMRDASIRRYESLVPELEAATGHSIPFNRDGIVLLRFADTDDEAKWRDLAALRQAQGWQLDLWDRAALRSHCPHVGTHLREPGSRAGGGEKGDCPDAPPMSRTIIGAVHSIHDRQVDPTALTHALIAAAKLNGAQVNTSAEVRHICPEHPSLETAPYRVLYGPPDDPPGKLQLDHDLVADWVVLCTGVGTFPLTQVMATALKSMLKPVDVRPVVGQAIRIKLPDDFDAPGAPLDFNPVISGNDIHVVPLGAGEYWVGATVEFPEQSVPGVQSVSTQEHLLTEMLQGAYDICPMLTAGTAVHRWVGQRPRPWNRPAPIIEPLAGYPGIILATGHYRNGVLLAPATAQRVREMVGGGE